MKRFLMMVLVAALPVVAMAQDNYSFDDEVNAELEKMYQSGNHADKKAVKTQVNVNVQSSPVAQNDTVAAQTATASAPAVQIQKQPTTVVEASPMQESKAELIRKSRQDAEIQTEQKIVEKLEASRLEDEKRRSDVLFGDKFKQLDQKAQADATQTQGSAVKIENSPNAVVTQTPAQTAVVPVAVVADDKNKEEAKKADDKKIEDEAKKAELDREMVRSEVKASLEELKPKEEEKPKNKSYFSGVAGLTQYPDVKNVRGNYSVGAAVGQKMNDRMLVEASFNYSNFDVEQRDMYVVNGYLYPRITNLDQYQGTAAVKYQLLGGLFRPYIGGLAAYSYRTYSDKQFGSSSNNAQSHAIDLGATGGVDLEVSESFTVGLDFRYLFNIYNHADNSGFQKSFAQAVSNSDTPLEQLSYLQIGLVGRMTF